MKKITSLALGILLSIPFCIKSQGPEIIYYNFNAAGPILPNLASSPPPGAANGTIVGGQTIGSTGQCGSALIGTGTNTDYVNTGWIPSLTGSWSIAFWSSNISSVISGSNGPSYAFGELGSTFRCFAGGVAGAGNWLLRGTGFTNLVITGGASPTPQHNTFVHNSTTGVTTSYLNGVFNASVTNSPLTISGSGPLFVGQYSNTNALPGMPQGGLLDEFRVYSRALTVQEVQQLASAATTPTVITASACGSYTSAGGITYTVSGTYTDNISSCVGPITNTINLTINPYPNVSIAAPSTVVCQNSALSLTASGANTYLWNTGATGSVIVVTPSNLGTVNYVVSGTTSGCSKSASVTISVLTCLGLSGNEYENLAVQLSPNPAQSYLNITTSRELQNADFELYNQIGQLVLRQELNETNNSIDLENISSGIYFIKIVQNNQTLYTNKVLKN